MTKEVLCLIRGIKTHILDFNVQTGCEPQYMNTVHLATADRIQAGITFFSNTSGKNYLLIHKGDLLEVKRPIFMASSYAFLLYLFCRVRHLKKSKERNITQPLFHHYVAEFCLTFLFHWCYTACDMNFHL